VEDEEPGLGPVAGLMAGLSSVTSPLAFAVSCDAPFIDPRIVAHLVSRCQPPYAVVVPLWEGRPQPLHAVYRADNAPILRRLLAAGRRRPVDLFAEVPTLEVSEAEIRALDPDGLTFMNTNTLEEWERALALDASREGESGSPRSGGRRRRRVPTGGGCGAGPRGGTEEKGRGEAGRHPLLPDAILMTVELLGLSRLLGKREQVELRVSPRGPLSRIVTALADAVPALVGVAIDLHGDRLAPGYLLNRNGREPLLAEEVSLAPGDHLLLLSAEVGG
jgi:MobA-like NTP transferase domain